jgi:transcriptional regulator with XRE-family HTH domain
MESFESWLNKELNNRGWSQSEVARRSGISPSMFSQVISGVANPGPDFLIGVARAFNLNLSPAQKWYTVNYFTLRVLLFVQKCETPINTR